MVVEVDKVGGIVDAEASVRGAYFGRTGRGACWTVLVGVRWRGKGVGEIGSRG